MTTALQWARQRATDEAFSALDVVSATVTPKGGEPMEDVDALWIGPITEEQPSGMQLRRAERQYGIALKIADVPELPSGSTIVCPEGFGGTTRTWRVEGPSYLAGDHRRYTIVPTD